MVQLERKTRKTSVKVPGSPLQDINSPRKCYACCSRYLLQQRLCFVGVGYVSVISGLLDSICSESRLLDSISLESGLLVSAGVDELSFGSIGCDSNFKLVTISSSLEDKYTTPVAGFLYEIDFLHLEILCNRRRRFMISC